LSINTIRHCHPGNHRSGKIQGGKRAGVNDNLNIVTTIRTFRRFWEERPGVFWPDHDQKRFFAFELYKS